jgi:hypothetical protein
MNRSIPIALTLTILAQFLFSCFFLFLRAKTGSTTELNEIEVVKETLVALPFFFAGILWVLVDSSCEEQLETEKEEELFPVDPDITTPP